jgi:hypothetical protein
VDEGDSVADDVCDRLAVLDGVSLLVGVTEMVVVGVSEPVGV